MLDLEKENDSRQTCTPKLSFVARNCRSTRGSFIICGGRLEPSKLGLPSTLFASAVYATLYIWSFRMGEGKSVPASTVLALNVRSKNTSSTDDW